MMKNMTRQRVVDIISAARANGEPPDLSGLDLSGLDLSGLDLSGADMSHTNLANTNLIHTNLADINLSYSYLAQAHMRGAYLADADMRYADMHGVNLSGAKLSDAYMHGADLRDVNLHRADLTGVKLCGLFTDGLPSGRLVFIPTPEGWHLIIGCWSGTTDELRAMIAKDTGWPEAEGEQITVRRPALMAAADMCDAYANANPDALADVMAAADRWKKSNS